jgi:hypothetical protein
MDPSIKPRTRAAWVYARRGAEMLSKVEQDVDEAAAHLVGRSERASVIPIGPDGAAAPPRPIQRAGGAAVQAVEATAEIVAGVSLDDQVDVISLDGEVHDAEVVAARGRERLKQC